MYLDLLYLWTVDSEQSRGEVAPLSGSSLRFTEHRVQTLPGSLTEAAEQIQDQAPVPEHVEPPPLPQNWATHSWLAALSQREAGPT